MPFFESPVSFLTRASMESDVLESSGNLLSGRAMQSLGTPGDVMFLPFRLQTPLGHLTLLVFEAVLEVVCVSLPGYIVARQGMFDAESQKFVANLNVALFTPCLIFTKLASQLTAEKLTELAVIPVIFTVQTLVSLLCARLLSLLFGFEKRPRNFLVAMSVFGNSNSLPISLVISLSKTLQGLHWDRIPGDNDNEVAARGILYLMIFQQLGQLVRWSWGYHVLLAPASHYEQDSEQGNSPYRDNPSLEHEEEDDDDDDDDGAADDLAERALLPPAQANGESRTSKAANLSPSPSTFESGGQTPVATDSSLSASASEFPPKKLADEPAPVLDVTSTPANGNMLQRPVDGSPNGLPMHSPSKDHTGERAGWRVRMRQKISQALSSVYGAITRMLRRLFAKLPKRVRQALTTASNAIGRFARGLWAFMNPPLWAMLAAIIVASIPNLQRLFFTPGTFVHNSVTSAISQSGGVAVPLILVVLGANLARNTLPTARSEPEDPALNRKLLIASLLGRMVLPTLIMAPLLALAAKYVPVSILDDPIFVVVCFLLTGAPSALQLAQICQINEVYEVVMSNLLFQSYVIWILPSTLFLVMCALEVVRWANVEY